MPKQTGRALEKRLQKIEQARGRLGELAQRIRTTADTINELLHLADSVFGATSTPTAKRRQPSPARKTAAATRKPAAVRKPAAATRKPAAARKAAAPPKPAAAPKRVATRKPAAAGKPTRRRKPVARRPA